MTSSAELKQAVLWVAEQVGRPYVEAGESDDVVQTIQPSPPDAQLQTSRSYSVELRLHVENLGETRVPDWVVIGCAQNTERALTLVADSDRVVTRMLETGADREISLLQEPRFHVLEPSSFARKARRDRRIVASEFPAVVGQRPRIGLNVDFEAMGSDSPEHVAALRKLEEAASASVVMVCLEPGSILLLRNTAIGRTGGPFRAQCIHGRGPFTPEESGERLTFRVFAADR